MMNGSMCMGAMPVQFIIAVLILHREFTGEKVVSNLVI